MRLTMYKMAFDNILSNLNIIYLILSESVKVSPFVTQNRNSIDIVIVSQRESAVDKDACCPA